MRWFLGQYLLVCAFLFWNGAAYAGDGDAGTIASLSEQLQSAAIGKNERIRLLFERGLAYDRLGELDDAETDYTAILDIAPNDSAALNNRANVYRRQGRLLEAKRDYLASLVARNPSPAYSETGLGQIAEAQGDVPGARDHYRRALAADRNYSLAAQSLAALGPEEVFSTVHLMPPRSEAGAAAEPERIVLKQPPREEPVVLRRPQPRRAGWTRVADARSHPSGLFLRPAIAEESEGSSAPMPYQAAGKYKVQLGAYRTRAEAGAALSRARSSAGEVLADVWTEIVEADIPGKGRYFRLRAGAVSRSAATALCAKLKTFGLACILAPR